MSDLLAPAPDIFLPYATYHLDSGRVVECQVSMMENCGLTLLYCKDGHDYVCQLSVRIDEYAGLKKIERDPCGALTF